MKTSDRKLSAVLALPAPKRYSHFVKVVADQNKVWGLHESGWALMSTEDGKEALALWPAEPYALACAAGPWKTYVPRDMQLKNFLDLSLPDLKQSGKIVAVFPTPSDKGITPDLEQLEEDIRAELSRIE